MYKNIFFDISGVCNARCKYCQTGSNIEPQNSEGCNFVDVDDFKATIHQLQKEQIISDKTCFFLFNWGEPLIHPRIKEILEFLNTLPNKFVISSNLGVFPNLDSRLFKNLREAYVSIPGFSQESYDRMHGLNFEKVKKNIDKLIEAVGHRKVEIVMHQYKYNLHEIEKARQYVAKKHTIFRTYPAYLNSYTMAKEFIEGSLNSDFRQEIKDELIMDYVDDLLNERPKSYICPQYDYLTIDENCNYIVCCGIPKSASDYSLGSALSLTKTELVSQKKRSMTCSTCKECQSLKIDYWLNNPPRYPVEKFYRHPIGRLKALWWRLKRPYRLFL